jgi:tetratricopeptide (TPR) repeat protein
VRLFICAALCLMGVSGLAPSAMALTAPQTSQPSTSQPDLTTTLPMRIGRAGQDAVTGKAAAAKSALLDIIAQPEFAALDARTRFAAYCLLASIEHDEGDDKSAYEHMLLAAETGQANNNFDYWSMLDDIAFALRKHDVCAEALIKMITISPEKVNQLGSPYITGVVYWAKKLNDNGIHRKALLEALWQGKYTPPEPFAADDAESLWFDLFEIYMAEGQTQKAEAILPALTQPSLILRLRIDNRYRPYALLVGPNELAAALMLQNQLPEALEVMDAALQKIASAPKDKPAFDDLDVYLSWTHSTRAEILNKLGRWDEALAGEAKSREIALSLKEETISHAINLGGVYYALGRPNEALEALTFGSEEIAPYGLMAIEEVRACAYAQLRDKDNMEKSLNYMRDHSNDGFGPLEYALLCANKGDEVAKLIISRLDDPQLRNETLVRLQTYLLCAHPTAYQLITRARYKAVLEKRDVKAAIERYGVIEQFPIFAPYH